MSSEESFCGSTLENVHSYYLEYIQGYIDIPICIIGVIFNIFNIMVFTRRNMKSPVNLIFAHLAFVNLSELLAYVSYIWTKLTYYSKETNYEEWTYTRAIILMLSAELNGIFYNTSVFIVMTLAIWKYIAVFYPSKESQWCNTKSTRNTVIAGYIICILLFIPEYLSDSIKTLALPQTTKAYIYSIEIDSIVYSASQFIKIVLYELLPSLVLPILGIRLIATLWMNKDHPSTSSNVENSTNNVEMKQTTDRSIIILITIVTLCLSNVIASGLLDLVYAVIARGGYAIHYKCYHSLIIMRNIWNCIDKSIIFLVYYAMNQDFKVTFKSLFDKNNASFWKLKYVPVSSTRGNNECLEIDRI